MFWHIKKHAYIAIYEPLYIRLSIPLPPPLHFHLSLTHFARMLITKLKLINNLLKAISVDAGDKNKLKNSYSNGNMSFKPCHDQLLPPPSLTHLIHLHSLREPAQLVGFHTPTTAYEERGDREREG